MLPDYECKDDLAVIELAAKYICNFRDGLCPMVLEGFECKWRCSQETLPWHCWAEMFREKAGGRKDEDGDQPNRPVI